MRRAPITPAPDQAYRPRTGRRQPARWRSALRGLTCGAAALLGHGAAAAQTLFLDLNNAGGEIAVVRWHLDASHRPAGPRESIYERLARQNGTVTRVNAREDDTFGRVDAAASASSYAPLIHEISTSHRPDLHVVPSFARITPAARAAVMKAALENERLTLLAQDCAAPEPGKVPRGCDTVWDELRRTELEREAATGHYSFDDLQREVESVLARVPRFDRVVVSGHHEGGFFRGELVSLTREQLQSLFVRVQKQAAAPFTLLLLGCDTAQPAVLREMVVPSLAYPRQTLIIGAEASAPTRFEPRNLSFVDEALTLQTRIHREPQALRAFQQQLRRHRWPVALWLGGQYESQDFPVAVPLPVASAGPGVAGALAPGAVDSAAVTPRD